MNQDLSHFGKRGLRADNAIIYINPSKIGIRIAFPHTFCMRVIKKLTGMG